MMAVRPRHRSSATPLALAYAALVMYASLYPALDWRWPPGQDLSRLALLPWTNWRLPFDIASNLLGYMPLGALVFIAARRSGWRARFAFVLAVLLPALLSYGTELLQNFIPRRVPAMEDLLMNAAGGLVGALLGLLGHALGLVDRWQDVRARWFVRDSSGALALLALWPVALLFPTPVPLGLGQWGERLREWLLMTLDDVPWAAVLHDQLSTAVAPDTPLRPLTEWLIVAAGLLAPCLLAYTVAQPGWRRLALAAGALVIGAGGMTLATALNFGPEHALGWMTPTTVPGLVLGSVLAVGAAFLPRRLIAGLGLVALSGLVVGVAQAPSDPYFADNLQAWEQGRFVRFHGLAQWIGWLWPYAAMLWLLGRVAKRETSRD